MIPIFVYVIKTFLHLDIPKVLEIQHHKPDFSFLPLSLTCHIWSSTHQDLPLYPLYLSNLSLHFISIISITLVQVLICCMDY